MTLVHRLYVPLALIFDSMRSCWEEGQVTLVHRLHEPLALILVSCTLVGKKGK